jgi:hypothetical protein
MNLPNDTRLSERIDLPVFIETYQKATHAMRQGFEQAAQARRALEALLRGEPDYNAYKISNLMETELKDAKAAAWRWLLARSGAQNILSRERQMKFETNLQSGNAPEPTLQSALDLFSLFRDNDLAREAIQEAFDALRPGKCGYERYKTNKKSAWKVATKVILTYCLRVTSWKREPLFEVIYESEARLNLIDRAFHLLDGKAFDVNAYKSPLADAINTTPLSVGRGETEYFRFKCYRNGNLHLEIRRADLLRELNRIGGEGRAEIGNKT